MRLLACSSLLALASLAPAQNRVFFNGTPTNLLLDLSSTLIAFDASASSAFYAVMPLSTLNGGGGAGCFATWDPGMLMDILYGPGAWLRCRMEATAWAYLTDEGCAHAAGPAYGAPLSLLTTDFDFGPYAGIVGAPFQPFPNSTLFFGNYASHVMGLGNTFTQERWQLRTRGWDPLNQWNACGAAGVTPEFAGFLVAHFTIQFL